MTHDHLPTDQPIASAALYSRDKNIREVAAIVADYITPEGHDLEEWAQLCDLAEKILRQLNLWHLPDAHAQELQRRCDELEKDRDIWKTAAHSGADAFKECQSKLTEAEKDAAFNTTTKSPPVTG